MTGERSLETVNFGARKRLHEDAGDASETAGALKHPKPIDAGIAQNAHGNGKAFERQRFVRTKHATLNAINEGSGQTAVNAVKNGGGGSKVADLLNVPAHACGLTVLG